MLYYDIKTNRITQMANRSFKLLLPMIGVDPEECHHLDNTFVHLCLGGSNPFPAREMLHLLQDAPYKSNLARNMFENNPLRRAVYKEVVPEKTTFRRRHSDAPLTLHSFEVPSCWQIDYALFCKGAYSQFTPAYKQVLEASYKGRWMQRYLSVVNPSGESLERLAAFLDHPFPLEEVYSMPDQDAETLRVSQWSEALQCKTKPLKK